ncbi:helix-turn-helix domain-containing protein [Streptomyces ambofaciens]
MAEATTEADIERPARGQLRSALIAESFVLLSEKGLAGFSVAELARRLKVSTAAPYRHFRNREALLAVVAAQGRRRTHPRDGDRRTGRRSRPGRPARGHRGGVRAPRVRPRCRP